MTPLVELQNVTLARDGVAVLQGVDLTLTAGERLAIVGPNGAGKTTLLRAIVGLERPAQGTIRLFGASCVEERDFRPFRPRIGYLFQDSEDQLFCPTVLEDVCFGPLNMGLSEAQAQAQAADVLDALGIGHLADRISHRLSGGEKRLVCLAGLLAMRPDVLMLDEPTNGVDVSNGRRLRDALRTFSGALLLVSHDDAFISELATHALVIQDQGLVPAQIHTHPHSHSHPHVHPAS